MKIITEKFNVGDIFKGDETSPMYKSYEKEIDNHTFEVIDIFDDKKTKEKMITFFIKQENEKYTTNYKHAQTLLIKRV